MQKGKIHHRLKLYENNTHYIVAGVLIVFGCLMLFGIPSFPKNLILSLVSFCFSYLSFKILKTTKPIIITNNTIRLGKLVNGLKNTDIGFKTIKSIELVYETKAEFRPTAIYTGGEVEVFSNYYRFNLIDKSEIKFDNLYDKQLQFDIKEWCRNNNIDLNLNVKKVID